MSPSAILRCQEVKHLLADILHPRAIRYCSSDHVLQFVVIDLSAMNNGDISLWSNTHIGQSAPTFSGHELITRE